MILRNKPATNAVFSFEAVSSRTITGSGGWAFPNRRATATGIIAFGCDSGSIDPPRIEIKTFNDPGGLPRWKTTVTAFISGVTLAYDSGWTTLTGGGFPTETVLIEIDGLRVKNRCGSTSQLIWSELRVRRNGTVVSTLGANTSTFSGYQFRKSFYQLTPELYTVNFPNIAKTGLSAPFDVTHYGSNGGIWTAYNGCDGEGACPPRLNNCRTYADAVAGSEVVNCLIKGGYTDNSGEAIVFETPLMGSVLAGSCDNVISYPTPSVSDPTNIVVEHKQTMNWSGRLDEANETCSCPAIDGYSIAFQLPRIRDKWRETKDWENVRSAIMLQRKETGPIARSTYRYTRCTPNLTTLVSQVDNLTDTDTISRVDLYRWVAKHERWCERVTQTGTCIYSPTGPGYPGFTSSPSCPAFPTPTSFYTEIGGHSVWREEPTCIDLITFIRGVTNLSTADNRFLRGWSNSTGARVRYWNTQLPVASATTQTLLSGSDVYQVRLCADHRLRTYALVSYLDESDSTPKVSRTFSDDGGATWSTLTDMGIANGRYADNAANPYGDLIEAAFVFDSGSTTQGTIRTQFKGSGDASFSTPAAIRSSTAELKFEPESFGLSFTADSADRLVLSARIAGETDPSEWYSTDWSNPAGMTFTRF